MRLAGAVCLVALAGALMPAAGRGGENQTDRVARLIGQLGHPRFAQREAASRELEAVGEPAVAALRTAAASDPDAEVARRAGLAVRAIARRVTRRELDKLQGAWSLVRYELDGKRVQGENRAHTFTFQGDRWWMRVGGQVAQAGTVERIEVKAGPNAIDLLITEGGNVGATAVSIYAVEGDSLKYLNSGEPRATAFTTKPGDGRSYLVFRRDRP